MMQERERKRAQRLDDQREAAGEVNQYPARLYFWLLLFNGRCFVYEISLSGMAKVAITCRAMAH